MNKFDELKLNKSDQEIHAAFERFNMKWQSKAERVGHSDRISRF